MQISNDAQLYAVFTPIIQDAVRYTMEQATSTFKNYIEKYVYGAGDPEEYMRTYEFVNSWENEVNENFFGAEGILGQNTSYMSFTPEMLWHGSYTSGDVRDNLAEILFEGLGGTTFFGSGWWNDKRNAYDEFVKDIESKDLLVRWFRDYLRKYGIYLRKA